MKNASMTNRRQFLQMSSMGIVGATLMGCTSRDLVAEVAAPGRIASNHGARPKRIIFLVSDGMSQGVVSLAEQFSLRARNRGTHFAALLRNDHVAHGWFETYSLNSLVTDSAAAGSAWGSGSRVFNGALNTLPDGTPLTPIFELARAQGWGTGVATTATVTHATPAAFVVAHPSRGDEDSIAVKYLGHVDVALGGGIAQFDPATRRDGRDLFGEFEQNGYTVVRTRDELLAAQGHSGRLLGTFDRGMVPYTIDQLHDEDAIRNVPTLAEMTTAALETLERHHPNGWLLQVEGARVDHAAHTNDAPGIIWDQLAFDDAVGVALDFARRHPDTLIVVTSDHGNANPGLNHFGGETDRMFERLLLARGTTHAVRSAITPHVESPADIHQGVLEMLGIDLSEADARLVQRMLRNDFDMVTNRSLRNFHGAFNSLMTNHTGVGWTSTNHTEDYVLIAAVGPMQDRFNKLVRNTEAFDIMADAMGSAFRNPSMTHEEARRVASAMPVWQHEGDLVG